MLLDCCKTEIFQPSDIVNADTLHPGNCMDHSRWFCTKNCVSPYHTLPSNPNWQCGIERMEKRHQFQNFCVNYIPNDRKFLQVQKNVPVLLHDFLQECMETLVMVMVMMQLHQPCLQNWPSFPQKKNSQTSSAQRNPLNFSTFLNPSSSHHWSRNSSDMWIFLCPSFIDSSLHRSTTINYQRTERHCRDKTERLGC